MSPLDLPPEALNLLVATLKAQGNSNATIAEMFHKTITVKMGYACDQCFVILSPILGWNYKTAKRPKERRALVLQGVWREVVCGK